MSSTASGPNFRFHWVRLQPGIHLWWNKLPALPLVRLQQAEFAGPLLPWWILRAMHAGAAWRRAQERIRSWGLRWRQRMCEAIRAHDLMHPTASPPARNITLGTELLRADAITTPPKSLSIRCVNTISPRFKIGRAH